MDKGSFEQLATILGKNGCEEESSLKKVVSDDVIKRAGHVSRRRKDLGGPIKNGVRGHKEEEGA